MNARTQTARGRAVAAANAEIDNSQRRAVAARQSQQVAPAKPRSALEAMAMRLNVSASGLKNTLIDTVFKGCRNESEFIALVLVSNTYGLNPLLKEIYAFPAKGGGVVPMVSVDGWIKLMQSHPAYDGIEFEDVADDAGEIYAIEATIYRLDNRRPTKIMEYLDECKRNTDPWNKSPLRMLRHRALMQCARVAFGFSGIGVMDEGDVIDMAIPTIEEEPKVLPTRSELAQELDDDIPNFEQRAASTAAEEEQADPETGEIIDQQDTRGMTEVDEETARALDAGDDGEWSEEAQETVEAIDGPLEGGDAGDDEPAWVAAVAQVRKAIAAAKNAKGLGAVENDWLNRVRAGVDDDEVIRAVEKDIQARRAHLKTLNREG